MRRIDGIGRDLVRGALAGAVATWVMDRATTAYYELQDPRSRERERAVSQKPAYRVAAERLAAAAGISATDEQLDRMATALHWGLGIGAGAVYAALRRRDARMRAAHGLAFGLGFFLLVDEALNTAAGFSAPPTAYPVQTHVRGLVGHLVYGLVTETALELLEGAA